MNKKKSTNQSNIDSQSNQGQMRGHYDDEIDLVELLKVFWSYKYLFVLITSVSVLIGFVYLKLETPIYQASYYFSKPSLENINDLNQPLLIENQNSDISFSGFSQNDVFEQFQQKLQSVSSFIAFTHQDEIRDKFNSNYQIELPNSEINNNLIELFSESLTSACDNLEIQNKLFETKIESCLSFNFPNPNQAAEILNLYLRFVSEEVIDELVRIREIEIINEIERLEKKASNLKNNYFSSKQQRTASLREALEIAKKSDISESAITEADNRFNMEYMRGTEALEAELNELINREDELFISGLQQTSQKVADLKKLSFNKNKFRVYKTELEALVPEKPIKPNNLLIILIFLFVGFVCSIFVVLAKNSLSKVNFK